MSPETCALSNLRHFIFIEKAVLDWEGPTEPPLLRRDPFRATIGAKTLVLGRLKIDIEHVPNCEKPAKSAAQAKVMVAEANGYLLRGICR